MMKSVWFIAIRSAVNWHAKWYWASFSRQRSAECGYFDFSSAWAMVHCVTCIRCAITEATTFPSE